MAYGLGPTDSAVALTLPTPQIGSSPNGDIWDNGDIVHERVGLVVGVRSWSRARRFRLVYNAISEATMGGIKAQLILYRTLYYYTDTSSLTSVLCRVVNSSFEPAYVGPGAGSDGLWSVSFELQEIVS